MTSSITSSGPERRVAPRKVLRTSVEVSLPDGTTFSARSIDISQSGMGFVCNLNLPAQSTCKVAFSLIMNGKASPIALRGTVAYTALQQAGFMVGLKFDSVPANVSAIIGRFVNI
jgi:c-di-GMP-binding flagellar brake protein YcgR